MYPKKFKKNNVIHQNQAPYLIYLKLMNTELQQLQYLPLQDLFL